MKDRNIGINKIIIYGFFISLTTVMTMIIQIPSPATKGYINLGDMMIFTVAILMGRKAGFIIGGIGSALADLLLGYNHYVPITFIVKGLEGYITGFLFQFNFFKRKPLLVNIIGGLIMTSGYFIFQIYLYGYKVSLLSIPGNLIQGFIGAVSSVALIKGLSKVDYFKHNFDL